MRDAVARDLGATLGLGENERSLQHRLGVKSEALGAPCRVGRVKRLGGGDVLGDAVGMPDDVGLARLPDRRMRIVGLLHHGARRQVNSAIGPVRIAARKSIYPSRRSRGSACW